MSKINFRELVKILNKLEKTSKQIIAISLDTMAKLKLDENELLEDAMEEGNVNDEKKPQLLEALRDLSMKWVRDATIILDEAPNFVTDEDGVFIINIDSGECPFLTEVWNGDYYDQIENEGLSELLKDLQSQLADVNEDKLIENALKTLL